MTLTPPPVVNVTETTYRISVLGRVKVVACTQAAVVMGGHRADPAIPETVAEMIRLYGLSAHDPATGGTTQRQILTAMKAAWGHTPRYVTSWTDALTQLRAGAALTVAGVYGQLPSHLRRWEPGFTGFHEVCVSDPADDSADPLVWWRDPLGHDTKVLGITVARYNGEWVRWSVVKAFALLPVTGYILVFGKGAWAMPTVRYPADAVSVGSFVADANPLIEFIATETGARFHPAAGTPYPVYRGPFMFTIKPGLPSELAYETALDGGVPFSMLARNGVYTRKPALDIAARDAIAASIEADASGLLTTANTIRKLGV